MKSFSKKVASVLAIVMMVSIFSFGAISNAAEPVAMSNATITLDGQIADWANVTAHKATKGFSSANTDLYDLTIPWQIQIAWDGIDSVYVLGTIAHLAPFTAKVTDKTDGEFWKEQCFELWFINEKPNNEDWNLRNADYKATALHYAWNLNTHFEFPADVKDGVVQTGALLAPDDYKIIGFGEGGLPANSWGVEAKIKLPANMIKTLKDGKTIFFNAGNTAYPTTYEAGPVEYSLLNHGEREDKAVLFWNVNALFELKAAPNSYIPNPPDADTIKKPAKVSGLKVKNNKKKTTTITWKALKKDATGYQVEMSSKSAKKGFKVVKKINKVKTAKYIRKNLKKGKTFYFRVRAVNKVGGKTVYGKYSAVKKVKIKK